MKYNKSELNSDKIERINIAMDELYDLLPCLYESLVDEDFDDTYITCKTINRKINAINKNKFRFDD
jgi:hypothetical protein